MRFFSSPVYKGEGHLNRQLSYLAHVWRLVTGRIAEHWTHSWELPMVRRLADDFFELQDWHRR